MPLLYPRPVETPSYQRMLSIMNAAPSPCSEASSTDRITKCAENVTEVDNAADATDALFKLVVGTMPTSKPIILRCNLPTWQLQDASAEFGLDLYDLRALHEKSLVLVHGFIDKLNAAGYQASYKLTMSSVTTTCSLVRVTSGDPYESLPQKELDRLCTILKEKLPALIQRDRLYVTTLCSIPSVIIA